MNPLVPKLGAIVLVLGTMFAAGWAVNGWRWEARYVKLDAQFAKFKSDTASAGQQARLAAAGKALKDQARKEAADEKNRRTITALRSDIERMRDDRDRARGSGVPPAPAASERPDLAAFDRAELERAYGALVAGLRTLVDECTKAVVDLDTAKQWL
jgi:hypothetical protein